MLRKIIPDKVRIPAFIVIVASLVTDCSVTFGRLVHSSLCTRHLVFTFRLIAS
ncbi:MAG: hypothetical protein ACLR2O_07495 [Coprococcus sp.]